MANNLNPIIEQAAAQSIQSDATYGNSLVYFVPVVANANARIAPWWSTTRDTHLREFWKSVDYLSGAVYTMTAKMTAIPNKVVPKDTAIKRYAEQAEFLTQVIQITPGKGEGWVNDYGKWVEDLITQDNGAFWEVIGAGNPAGPIIGQPISFAHLDSSRCTRTGDSIYPVVYQDVTGKRYKLHYTRVMFTSQQPSPIKEMFGVGFSSVSRCLNVAQSLLDILIYKQEKLGSRPHREILITQGGLSPSDLAMAFARADSAMSSQGLTRYSKIVVGGDSTLPTADVKVIELSTLPDGFNEENNIVYGMATIALAFGVDARELFPAMSAGSTRADALLQHLKQRGKGPGQILQVTEQLLNYKFLPPHLRFEFDFQDDAQDRQVAEIRGLRATARVQDTTTGVVNDRVMREKMLEDGDINRSQFERMELESGRLPDGVSVLTLFYQKNGDFTKLLDIGVSDPLNKNKNNPEKILGKIANKRAEVMELQANAVSQQTKWNALVASAALDQLELVYTLPQMGIDLENTPAKPNGNGGVKTDNRIRTQDTRSATSRDLQGGDNRRDFQLSPDDEPL